MKKNELEQWLRNQLSDLPKGEVDGILIFYTSAIEDRMEDGMTEEEAVQALGDPEAILAEIRSSRPMTYFPSHPPKSKKRGLWAAGALLLGLGVVIAIYSTVAIVTGFNPIDKIFGRNIDDPVQQDIVQVLEGKEYETQFYAGYDLEQAWTMAGELRLEAVNDGDYYGYQVPHDLAANFYNLYLECDAGGVQLEGWSEPYLQVLFLYPEDYNLSCSDGFLWVFGENPPSRSYDKRPAVRIFVPESTLSEIQLQVDAGNLQITGLTVSRLFVQTDAGNIILDRVLATELLDLQADAGNITLQSVSSDGDLSVQVDAGNIELNQVDAMSSLSFITDAGSVTGTLAGPSSRYSWEAKVDIGSSNLARQVVSGPVPLYLQTSIGSIDIEFASKDQSWQIPVEQQAQISSATEDFGAVTVEKGTSIASFEMTSLSAPPSPPEAPSPSVWFFGRNLFDLLPWNW